MLSSSLMLFFAATNNREGDGTAVGTWQVGSVVWGRKVGQLGDLLGCVPPFECTKPLLLIAMPYAFRALSTSPLSTAPKAGGAAWALMRTPLVGVRCMVNSIDLAWCSASTCAAWAVPRSLHRSLACFRPDRDS